MKENFKISNRILFIILSLSFLIIYNISSIFKYGSLKYIRFFTPLLLLLLPIIFKSFKVKNAYNSNFLKKNLYLLISISIVTVFSNLFIFSTGFTYRNLVNIVFLISPVLSCYYISIYCKKEEFEFIIKFLFITLIFCYLLELVKNGTSFSSILKSITSSSFVNSDSETESGSSLIFGFFTLYYLNLKKYKESFIAILLVILGAKRIAIAGTLISIIVYLSYPSFITFFLKRGVKKVSFFISLLLIIVANIWTTLFSGIYDQAIQKYTGKSPNAFFMGRLNRIDIFFHSIKDHDNYFIGYGIGYVENIFYYSMKLFTPFHNDFYRIFLEFGPILFFYWCFIMTKYTILKRLSFSSFVLLIILMQTDNVLIYENVMYTFYLITIFSLNFNNKAKSF